MGENSSVDDSASASSPLPAYPLFGAQQVPDACLVRLIEAARPADAGWNFPAWRWIVVRSEQSKRHLEAAILLDASLRSAPVVLICLADTQAWKSAPRYLREMVVERRLTEQEGRDALQRVRDYYSSSPDIARRTALVQGAAAAHQILLGAPQYNLSTYCVTEFDESKIKNHFHVPDNFLVTALLPMGYSKGTHSQPTANPPFSPLIYNDKFGELLNPLPK